MDASAGPLELACLALWNATLSLMAAYMQQSAPAHRLLLARRIAANFATLADQPVFAPASRAAFARLHARWQQTAAALARPTPAPKQRGLLERLQQLRLRQL